MRFFRAIINAMTTRNEEHRTLSQRKARTNLRLLPETKRKLALVKERLGMSETAYIEMALRAQFHKDRIE